MLKGLTSSSFTILREAFLAVEWCKKRGRTIELALSAGPLVSGLDVFDNAGRISV